MRLRQLVKPCVLLGISTLFVGLGGVSSAWAQSERSIEMEVERRLLRDEELQDVEASVEGQEVLLIGTVPTLWAKQQIIAQVLEIEGVQTVASELIIPRVSNENAILARVAEAIHRYENYTIFDFIDGNIIDGVVTLHGGVTAFPDKSGDILERVARVSGVQYIDNQIQVLPPSRQDDVLRQMIANEVFSNTYFTRYAGMQPPPFHIIVNNNEVVLVGIVGNELEKIELERIARRALNAVTVYNNLEVRTGSR